MEPLADSSDIVQDGPALAQRMKRDGYLFLPRLLPAQIVLAVRRQLLELAAEGGWLVPDQPIERGIANRESACCDPEPRYVEVFKNLWKNEDLHALRHHQAILGVLERMLGEPVLVHPLFVQRNIFPQADDFDFTTKSHQDVVHIGGGKTYAAWSPIGDCAMAKGPVCIAAGSHRDGVLDFRVGPGPGGIETDPPDSCHWHGSDFGVGDVVIFSDTTVHRALPNRTDELRQSLDARYQRLRDPIAETNLRAYGNMMAWDEVYAGWESTEFQYYWENLDLAVVPYDMQYYERRDAITFEMAERGDRNARDTLLRIVQRDPDAGKRDRAAALLQSLGA